jgi:hypothetical protein
MKAKPQPWLFVASDWADFHGGTETGGTETGRYATNMFAAKRPFNPEDRPSG